MTKEQINSDPIIYPHPVDIFEFRPKDMVLKLTEQYYVQDIKYKWTADAINEAEYSFGIPLHPSNRRSVIFHITDLNTSYTRVFRGNDIRQLHKLNKFVLKGTMEISFEIVGKKYLIPASLRKFYSSLKQHKDTTYLTESDINKITNSSKG